MEMKSRRTFLVACLGGAGAMAAALVSFPFFRFLAPRKEAGSKAKVEIPAVDVPEGGAKFFEFEGRSAVIVRKKGGGFVALSAVCTHLGCIVQWQKNQEQFLCPCHAGLYSVDGTVISGPPPKPLPKLPFTVTEGNIIVG
jgi:cytochrome b6-f complex iron-sulfur subunit